MHRGDAQPMAGDADEPGQAFIACAGQRLHRAPGCMRRRPVLLLDEVVQLNEIDRVDTQPLERALKRRARARTAALVRLRRQEELRASGRQPRREAELGVAVVRGDIYVVHAELV